MHDLTDEDIEKMRAAGYEPVEYIKQKVIKRPKLFALYGFKDETQFKFVVDFLTKEVQEHFKKTNVEWKIGIEQNPVKGMFLVVPEPLLNTLSDEVKNTIGIARTSYPTPIIQYSPKIFRYMDKQFVDDFFNDGKLRLSSFQKFAKHENNNMKDGEEGKVDLIVTAGKDTVKVGVGFGSNAFVLCGTVLDDRVLDKSFEYDAGLCIENVKDFIEVINIELKKSFDLEIYDVMHGPCMYLPTREIEGTSYTLEIDNLQEEFGIYTDPPSFNMDVMNKKIGEYVGQHSLFLKKNKYYHEQEYRIIWNIEDDYVPEFIDIVVPEAVKYCKRIR